MAVPVRDRNDDLHNLRQAVFILVKLFAPLILVHLLDSSWTGWHVHISQLDSERINKVEDIVQLGDEISVMVIGIDPAGKIRLSRQAFLEGWTVEQAQQRDKKPSGRSGGGRPGGSGRPSNRNSDNRNNDRRSGGNRR